MTAYLLANNDVHNPDGYAEYIKLITPTVESYGGRYLARGGVVNCISGPKDWHRMVLIEFPDYETVKAWLEDPDIAHIHELRETHATTEMVVLPGVPEPSV